MELKHPPIVEAWVGFRFEPNSEKTAWNTDIAMPFVDRFSASFPHIEVVATEEIRIEERTASGAPKRLSGRTSLERIRARDEKGTRWLQVGDDVLVYNVVLPGSSYPGYEVLKNEAVDKLGEYIAYFKPSSVRKLELHYVDIISIPSQDQPIDLRRFFEIVVQIPNTRFSSLERFSMDLAFARVENEFERMRLRFASEPRDAKSQAYRFRLDWHAECETVSTLEQEELISCLDRMRSMIRQRFEACFTPIGWSLFEPMEDEDS